MYKDIKNITDFNEIIEKQEAVLVYFSNEMCNVCKVLKPQVAQMVQENFPKIELVYVDIEKTPEISAQNSVFTIPTIAVYFQAKEYVRKSRHIGLGELDDSIERPYNLIFED